MKYKILFFFSLFFCITLAVSQNNINQFDDNGKRHGVWKKYFPDTNQIRYVGAFDHGKEVGVFKYYCMGCKNQPMILKTFNEIDNQAQVKYFTVKGKLVSEGNMVGKNRIGEWVYFYKRSSNIMTRENYVDGKLEGFKITYYPNNKITEETEYKNGLKEGINNYYSPEGVLLKKLLHKDDQLHGPATYYDANGNVIIEGYYKNGKKDGSWKSYKNGKLIKEETFPKPTRY